MPFKSLSQRRWMYANRPKMAERWQRDTPKGTKLPKRKKPVSNRRKFNPLRADPSRTATIRRQFIAELRKRFTLLRSEVYNLIVVEDAFGLRQNPFVGNYDPDEPRDEQGRWTGGSSLSDIRNKYPRSSKIIPGTDIHVLKNAEDSDWNSVSASMNEYEILHHVRNVPMSEFPGLTGRSYSVTETDRIAKLADKINRAKKLKPVLIGIDHKGPYILEGGHRAEALYKLGAKEIPGFIILDIQSLREKRGIVGNTRFRFHTTSRQIEAFRQWLASKVKYLLVGSSTDQIEESFWWQFIREAWRKGIGRAFDDVNRPALSLRKREGGKGYGVSDFYNGSKDQFLRSSFGRPESVEKVKLLAGRVFTELKGVTDAMAQQMTRVLTDGLAGGQNPRVIARSINQKVDGIGKARALAVARTEIIRAHAEGQLDAMEDMGVKSVGVMVEWMTADDDNVCPECDAMSGVVFSIDEAHGMIPRHPACRCAFSPANVGEDEDDQIRGKDGIDSAIDRSVDAESDDKDKTLEDKRSDSSWVGADTDIDEDRPESIV